MPPTLTIDGLNYLARLSAFNERRYQDKPPMAIVHELRSRVADFARLLRSAGIEAVAVFDNGQSTASSQAKWLQRRQKEVLDGVLPMPYALDLFLRTFFEDEGIATYSPQGIDGDDAVVMLAQLWDAQILSADGDMCFYGLPLHRIYRDFYIEGGVIHFVTRDTKPPSRSDVPREERRVETPTEAEICTERWRGFGPRALQQMEQGWLKRGNVDAFTKDCGNPHAATSTRALRAGVYHLMGLETVDESILMYEAPTQTANLVTTRVRASAQAVPMLRGSIRSCCHFLRRDIVFPPDLLDARRREHGVFMIAAELQTYARFAADHRAGSIRLLSARHTLAGYFDLCHANVPVPRMPYTWSARQRCRGLFEEPCTEWLLPLTVASAVQHGKAPRCSECIRRLCEIARQRREAAAANDDADKGTDVKAAMELLRGMTVLGTRRGARLEPKRSAFLQAAPAEATPA